MSVNSLFSITGKNAIVTGSAQGLGKEVALAFAEAGANIALVDRNEEGAKEVAKEINNMGREVLVVKIDLSRIKEIKKMVQEVKDKFGKIDILVNNAADFRSVPADQISPEEWYKTINDNLTSAFFCCQSVGKEMIKQKKGVIINISSIASKIVVRPQIQPHYHIAKSGMDSLTRTLAVEWAKYNIRINSVVPGYFKTPPVERMMKVYKDEWLNLIPQKRVAEASEIRGPVLFLASDASSYVTGTTLIVDGGYTIW